MNVALIIAGLLLGAFIFYSYYNFRKLKNLPIEKSNSNIVELTSQNFSHKIQKGVILVDFWAEWCMPCKMMVPVLNELVDALPENTGIGKLNVELHQSVASKLNIRNIPTLILFKDGKEINRFVGVKSKDFLLKQISNVA